MDKISNEAGRVLLCGVPEGHDSQILQRLAQDGGQILFIARDDRRMAAVIEGLGFFAPHLSVVQFPAWDCLPYDRAAPRRDIVAARLNALTRLADGGDDNALVVTTLAAVLQRVAPREVFQGAILHLTVGGKTGREALLRFLVDNGYSNTGTVMEPGEFAVRGGMVDLFPPGLEEPLRLDFFGDELDGLRSFEPFSQRSTGKRQDVTLRSVSEIKLDQASIKRFRTGYRQAFGAVSDEDHLYEAISAGRAVAGMEHWLPLFHETLATLFDYLPGASVVLDHQAGEAGQARWELIGDCYEGRAAPSPGGEALYNPLPRERLYVSPDEMEGCLSARRVVQLQPFAAPEGRPEGRPEGTLDAGGRPGADFSHIRARPGENVFDALKARIRDHQADGQRVLIAAMSDGARQRLAGIMAEHGIETVISADDWTRVAALPGDAVAIVVLGLERGFATSTLALISEPDILGERLRGVQRRKTRAENFIAEASALGAGDLVVHAEHGLARFEELVTLEVAGAAHDCLRLVYGGGDKLFVPVENIDVLSRYGEDSEAVKLDRLGGAAWQARKARLKNRIRDMAEKLISVAAARQLKPADVFRPAAGLYEEFCAAFPFVETEDQTRAIADVLDDLAGGRPMDRLICGDVGFGKTEVALRAAFVTAMEGRQVAIVVPTTLLARQHYQTFRQRFADFPLQVAQLSRLVPPGAAKKVRQGLADGTTDIVIGTHTLLAKTVGFLRLGLLVIDEEQHFGVAHKERLKGLKTNVHVLSLSATPIPRTLQLALSGVREMSLITTPPVDRLAIRTFVLPFDGVIVREAILRERFRGGQVFFVCPRIADIAGVEARILQLIPDLKIAVAHGQMPARQLEDVMAAFYEGAYDVLLSTNIVESGLDLPNVNTMIIHRADRFGLAQLYQLRGRIGRAKVRAYAYLTLPPNQVLTKSSQKRLEVMQTLDALGAGFTVASHDLDLRGAGNLLGEEQSGHIREVGVELYQQMLEEAVAEARSVDGGEGGAEPAEEQWSVQIDLGIPVLNPGDYVADLGMRLSLYRRIARLADRQEIDAFAAELIDRFGSLPVEVENLLGTVAIKNLCLAAGVDKVEAGPKGAVVSFYRNQFANPAGLVEFISAHGGTVKLRPDHKLVFMRVWDDQESRQAGVQYLMRELSAIAA